MGLNNIDTKQVVDFKKEIQKKPEDAKFTAKIEGDWLFEEGGAQFRSVVKVKDGTYTMEASHPNFAGPGGTPRADGVWTLLVRCLLLEHLCY